jgi:peptidoglycan hydrolase CwlO-like protein
MITTHWRITMAKLNQNKIDKLFEQIDDSIEKIQEKQAEIKSIIENYIYEIDSDEGRY